MDKRDSWEDFKERVNGICVTWDIVEEEEDTRTYYKISNSDEETADGSVIQHNKHWGKSRCAGNKSSF